MNVSCLDLRARARARAAHVARPLAVASSLLALLLVAACSSDDADDARATSTSPTNPAAPGANAGDDSTQDYVVGGSSQTLPTPGTPTEAACSAYASASCARTKACAPGLFPALYESDAACVIAESRRCGIDAKTPGVTLSSASIGACATDLAAASCEDFIDERWPASCRPAGALTDGSACETELQCASGFCAGAKAAACGVCAAAPTAGSACVAGSCPSGLTCTKNVCVASKKIGDACKATRECGTGQICAGGQACAVAGGSGALCALDEDCNILGGFTCSFATNRCTKVNIAAVGQACGSGAGKSLCGAAGDCDDAGLCVARPKEGEACEAGGPRCAVGLACIAGACAFADASVCK